MASLYKREDQAISVRELVILPDMLAAVEVVLLEID